MFLLYQIYHRIAIVAYIAPILQTQNLCHKLCGYELRINSDYDYLAVQVSKPFQNLRIHAKSKHTPLTLPEEYIPGAGFDVSILALSQQNSPNTVRYSPNTVRYSPNTVRYSPATVRFVTMRIHQSLFVDKTDIFQSVSIYVSFTFVGFQLVSEPDPHVHSGSRTFFRSTIFRSPVSNSLV